MSNKTSNEQPPEWLQKAALHYLSALDLELWEVNLHNCTIENPEGVAFQEIAQCRTNPAQFHADLIFDLEKLEQCDLVTVVHEVMHVLFAELDQCVQNHIIQANVPEGQQQLAHRLYTYNVERLVQRLARVIVRLSKPE